MLEKLPWLVNWYPWLLSLHIIAIISWMAGILYLYRILIYASERAQDGQKVYELLALMGRRLYRIITLPAMLIAWAFGLSLLMIGSHYLEQGWIYVKLLAVIGLSFSTLYAGMWVKRFQAGPHVVLPASKRLRYLNEVPTILMIVIVFMVVMKPF